MDFFSYTFNEDIWQIFLIENDDEVIADSTTAAQVMFDNKEIYFRKESVNLTVVMHELVHVYMGYCYLGSTTDISNIDMEEIFAELFADKAEKIIERSKDIFKRLTELKDGK